jgi:hypothetical protein
VDFPKQVGVHEGGPTNNVDQLPGNPGSFRRTQQSHGIADAGRSSQAPHGRPARPKSGSGRRGFVILIVANGNAHATPEELESDAAPDPA